MYIYHVYVYMLLAEVYMYVIYILLRASAYMHCMYLCIYIVSSTCVTFAFFCRLNYYPSK